MSYLDALNRISQLESQLAALDGGSANPTTAATTATDPSTSGSTGSSFAAQLAQAQAVSPSTTAALGVDPAAASTLGAVPASTATGTVASGGQTAAAAPAASGLLSSAQQQFAARLSADTGLDPGVVDAWLLAEESGGAATARQSANNNDWLNIGYTDSATFGAGDSVWSDPVTAADATAGWLSGKNTIPGYGTASGGVQAILQTVGQAPSAQIAAIQGSGWASSGYPDLPALYQQVVS
jgi:hypothetical protein